MKVPHLHPVQSSNIQALGHDGRRLFVRFQGGGLYSYEGVPRQMLDMALEHESVGKWFHANVKGKYPHEQHDA